MTAASLSPQAKATRGGQALPISRRKKFLFSCIILSFFAITFLFLAEIVVRQKGLTPWIIREPYSRLEPSGNYLVKDTDIGYLTRPGESTITLPGPYSFKMTHRGDGLRITHPLQTYSENARQEIWIFGCSITHGWSLNDEQTYPWLLQEKLKNYEVINFGAEGFSTVQSLIQFKQAVAKRRTPALVILAYSSMHDQRNTLTRSWVKLRMTGNASYIPGSLSLPYMRFSKDQKPELHYLPLDYSGIPLLRFSAIANFLDDTLNGLLERTYHSDEISRTVIEDLAAQCKAREIQFLVAGISADRGTHEMLEYFNARGTTTADISVDLTIRENTNLPYDGHPSAIANRQYAKKLFQAICHEAKIENCPF